VCAVYLGDLGDKLVLQARQVVDRVAVFVPQSFYHLIRRLLRLIGPRVSCDDTIMILSISQVCS